MVPCTVEPSSPVTVRSLMVAENRVTVTGSFGATSVDPNFGLELTLTLLFSAVEALAEACWLPDASSPDTVTWAPAVEVTVTTTSPPPDPQAVTASRVANASASQPTALRAVRRRRLDRVLPFDRRGVRRTTRSSHHVRHVGAPTVGRARKVPVTGRQVGQATPISIGSGASVCLVEIATGDPAPGYPFENPARSMSQAADNLVRPALAGSSGTGCLG